MSAALKMPHTPTPVSSTDAALQLLSSQGFVQYHPVLADKLGSFKAALFLGHALYWARHVTTRYHSRDGWFFLSAKQCTLATGLSAREQASARQLLIEHSLIAEMISGRPAKLHYRVDLDRIAQLLGMSVVDSKTSWQQLLPLFNGCVSFYRPLADIAGNVASGLYLSYLLIQQRHFLTYPRQGAGFSVSQQAIRNALCLGPKTQRNARDRLKQIGLINEYGALVQVNMHALCALLQCQASKPLKTAPAAPSRNGTGAPDASKPALSVVPNAHAKPAIAHSKRLFGSASISQNQLFDLRTAGSMYAPAQQQSTVPAVSVTPADVEVQQAQSLLISALCRPAGLKSGRMFAGGQPNSAHHSTHLAGKQQLPAGSTEESACQTVAENAKLEMPPVAQNANHAAENAKLVCPKRKTKLPKTQNIKTTNPLNTTTNSGNADFDEVVDNSNAQDFVDEPCRRESKDSNPENPKKPVPVSELAGIAMPAVLDKQWHTAVRKVLAKARPENRQSLLDELEGQLSNPAKSISNPPGYLHSLRIGLEIGAVQLAYADSVAAKRREYERTAQTLKYHLDNRDEEIKAAIPPMTREEARAKLRRQAQEIRGRR